jgi:phage-related protein
VPSGGITRSSFDHSSTHFGVRRAIFCIADGRLVLLHSFIKKSQKTPQRDLELARARKRGEDR